MVPAIADACLGHHQTMRYHTVHYFSDKLRPSDKRFSDRYSLAAKSSECEAVCARLAIQWVSSHSRLRCLTRTRHDSDHAAIRCPRDVSFDVHLVVVHMVAFHVHVVRAGRRERT